jgi:glycerol-3-phosphate cytidylyltransferase-like family protein
MEHLLRNNEILRPSMGSDISDQLLNELQDTKERIEKQKEDWYIVAVVHLSWDLTHSAHIAYMNTIRAKLRKEIPHTPFKLLVWVETDTRTIERKNKENIFKEQERKYIFENLKATDRCYIEFEWLDEQNNQSRPAWIVQFLAPDVFVTHEEYVTPEEEEQVRQQAKEKWIPNTVIINYWDEEKYLWEKSMREKFNRSTTNTIKQVFEQYHENPKYNSFISSNQ